MITSSDIVFLSVDEVLEVHLDQIHRHGGEPSVRDQALLESAVSMPQSMFGGVYLHDYPHGMAAAYLYHLAANHPFVDGNKRTALASMLVFLDGNGLRLVASKDQVYDIVLGISTGKLDKTDVAAYLKQHIQP